MDTPLIVSTIGLICLPVHFCLTKTDLGDLWQWIERMTTQQAVDGTKKAWIQEEMFKLRRWNCEMNSSCFVHFDFFIGLGILHQVILAPGLYNIVWATVTAAAYWMHLVISLKWVEMTPFRLKLIACSQHVMLLLMILGSGLIASSFQWGILQGFHTSIRVALIWVFLDPWVSIPFQVLFTIAEILVCLCALDGLSVEIVPVCLIQLFIFTVSSLSSLLIDSMLQGRISSLLETADAESLVSSFQRMLRGVCEGEVLLDSEMKVAQESEGLKHLIFTRVSLVGRLFESLLVDEEGTRFKEFIAASTAAFGASQLHDSALPSCLRVQLRGSAGIRVAADIYHVPVPGLFGAKEPYHLIAFKEDPESRQQPEAEEDAVPAQLLDPLRMSKDRNELQLRQKDATSIVSGSSGRTSFVNMCPELQDMTLLVDVDTELHDVQQAELNFKRDERPGDLSSELQCTMPSLRKLVKPTDWEKVRSQVVGFVEADSLDSSQQSKMLKRIGVQLPGQSGWLKVEEVSIHRIQGSRKVLLHLNRFSPEKDARLQPSLRGIQEGIRERRPCADAQSQWWDASNHSD